jgi:hypothetical protein
MDDSFQTELGGGHEWPFARNACTNLNFRALMMSMGIFSTFGPLME